MSFRPTPFGRYVLMKRIAIGGMAEVFRAYAYGAEEFEKLVAIKRILPHLTRDPMFVDMFINEAKLAAKTNHSNIVQIYDFGNRGDVLYLSMEYVQGKDSSQIIEALQKKKMYVPVEMVCFIAVQVLNGLDHAHRQKDRFGKSANLIHRDVSPSNIIISYDGEVKIVDFGIAKAKESAGSTRSGVLKGKYAYMSPEQARGENLNHQTDIFSLAVTIYELLTLKPMFSGYNDLYTLKQVQDVQYVSPRQINPDIPAELEVVLNKALQKDPARRFASAAEFRDALEDYLASHKLWFSSSWLSKFMRNFFFEEIEAEELVLREEAQLARRHRQPLMSQEGEEEGDLETIIVQGEHLLGQPVGLPSELGDLDLSKTPTMQVLIEQVASGQAAGQPPGLPPGEANQADIPTRKDLERPDLDPASVGTEREIQALPFLLKPIGGQVEQVNIPGLPSSKAQAGPGTTAPPSGEQLLATLDIPDLSDPDVAHLPSPPVGLSQQRTDEVATGRGPDSVVGMGSAHTQELTALAPEPESRWRQYLPLFVFGFLAALIVLAVLFAMVEQDSDSIEAPPAATVADADAQLPASGAAPPAAGTASLGPHRPLPLPVEGEKNQPRSAVADTPDAGLAQPPSLGNGALEAKAGNDAGLDGADAGEVDGGPADAPDAGVDGDGAPAKSPPPKKIIRKKNRRRPKKRRRRPKSRRRKTTKQRRKKTATGKLNSR